MLKAFNQANPRKRSFVEESTAGVIDTRATLIKRARRILIQSHPAETPVADKRLLESLPNELKLHILNFIPYTNILAMRASSRLQYTLVNYDYYKNLLNSPAFQADLQLVVHNQEDLNTLFQSQQLEIEYFLTHAHTILDAFKTYYGFFSSEHLFNIPLDCPCAVSAACERYLGEACGDQSKRMINAIPLSLRNGFLGTILSIAIGERVFSSLFWSQEYIRIYRELSLALEKLKATPETVSPFTVFSMHQLLNAINTKMIRLKLAIHLYNGRPLDVIDLNSSYLTRLPAALLEDKALQSVWSQCITLDLACNKLFSLPLNLKRFENIRHLKLSLNDIETFPDVLLEMSLNRLNILINRLGEVPDQLSSILFDSEGVHLTKEQVLSCQEIWRRRRLNVRK